MLQWLKNYKVEVIALLVGVLLGVLGFRFPVATVLKAVGAVTLLILVLYKVEIAVFLVILLAPFITTMQLIGLIVLGIISFVIKLFISKDDCMIKTTPLSLPSVLFMVMVVYSSITSFSPRSSIFIALMYASFILFSMLAANTIKTKGQLRILIILFVLCGFIVSLYGIYQYYMADYMGFMAAHSWIDEEMFEDIRTRVYSTFDNPNVLGEYLVLLIPISIALLWTQKKGIPRLFFGIVTIAMGICLIYTSSRGSWLGLLLAIAVFAVLRDKRLIMLAIGGLLMLPFILPRSIINRFSSIGNLQDTSSAYRLSIWIGSLKVIREYWPSGIGLGSDAFIKIYPRYALSGAAFALHAHNIYLQILVETGITGFLAFLFLLLMFYKSIFSSYWRTEDKFLSTLMIALCAGVTGYLFQGLVDNIWYNYRVMLIFWIILSFAMAAHRLTNEDTGEEEQARPARMESQDVVE
ncbi:MAG: hypothetical protein GX066_09435 [Clostridiaceae bacterium]|nr:hypothetical protein [Clostridiaceae bacterium]